MILILYANCIIYIWRICDLPLVAHTRSYARKQSGITRNTDTRKITYTLSAATRREKQTRETHTRARDTHTYIKRERDAFTQPSERYTIKYPQTSPVPHVSSSPSTGFQLPWRYICICVYEQQFSRTINGDTYEKRARGCPLIRQELKGGLEQKAELTSTGMVRPDIKTDVQLRAILIARYHLVISIHPRVTHTHTQRRTYTHTETLRPIDKTFTQKLTTCKLFAYTQTDTTLPHIRHSHGHTPPRTRRANWTYIYTHIVYICQIYVIYVCVHTRSSRRTGSYHPRTLVGR